MYIKKVASTLLLIVFLLLFTSCNIFNANDGLPTNIESEFKGVYAQGIEDSWFYSCTHGESGWKPVFSDSSFNQLHLFWEKRDPDGSPLLSLTIRGVLSKKGKYQGYFTQYERKIEILEIIEIEYTDDTDC